MKRNREFFSTPTASSAKYTKSSIFSLKKIQKGGNADPFVIAKAAVAIVVTLETKKRAVRIPNICNHF